MNLTLMLIAIAVYLIFMVAIGFVVSKKNNTSEDFYLGGRKLGPIVTAMSAEASDMSSWLLMGLPGVALACGLAEASWTAIGLAIGTYINWLIVAKRIRIYSAKLDTITIPEFFSKRFGDKKNILNVIAALTIIVFFIPYTASGFNACGTLFSNLAGDKLDYLPAMIISAVVIVIYTTLGGFLAASITDLIQSIIMTIALIVVVFFGINYAGGMNEVVSNANSMPGFLGLTETFSFASNGSVPYNALTIASTLAWGFGYFGMPHILVRFMAIEDTKKLSTSRRVGTIWVVISMAIAVFIGVVGNAVVKAGHTSIDFADSNAPQTIIVELAKLISNKGTLFAILGGFILAGILASTMSTSDSQLLAAASGVSENIVRQFFGIKLKEKTAMLIARITVVVISIIAIFWARKEGQVFSIVAFAWAGFGAAFGPVVLFSLFWKRTNKWGALAGMISGGATVFIWKYIVRVKFADTILNIYELLPAFIVSCILIVAVSLLTKAPESEITSVFDEVKEELK